MMRRRFLGRKSGFSLIELLVAVTVIGILASIAIPAYTNYAMRNRRSDAINSLLQLQLAQERWRTSNISYTSNINDIGSASSLQGFYNLVISNATGVSYTMTATAQGVQTNDTKCLVLTITQSGPVIANNTDRECWGIQ